MPQDIIIPDLGDFKDVEVIDVLIKPGDTVEVDAPLITLETEKATMDVPATSAGVIKSVAVKKGDRVSKGSIIGQLDSAATDASAAPAQAASGGTGSAQPAGQEASEQKAAPQKTSGQKASAQQAVATPGQRAPGSASPAPQSAAQAAAPADDRGERPAPAQQRAQPSGQAGAAPGSALPAIDEAGFARAYASPSVRKFARQLGVDLAQVRGTGVKGRITPEDVKEWVKQALAAGAPAASGAALPKVPEIDFSRFGAIELKPLGRIQKIAGPRLQASWLNVPHVWQMDEADITEMEEARNRLKQKAQEAGIRLTPLAFILRACVKALQEFPLVNSSLDPSGQNLVLKKYVHLGFAADTPGGLVVPVIREADKKDVYELARELGVLSEKARAGKLSAAEMQGASFTISSLGGIGGTSFTPIINAPEVAILGVARASTKPVYQDGQFVPRVILPFTFAYDHRVIDGAEGARFTTYLANQLADVKSLLEAVP